MEKIIRMAPEFVSIFSLTVSLDFNYKCALGSIRRIFLSYESFNVLYSEIGRGPKYQTVQPALKKFLTNERSRIVDRWRNLIIGSYPSDTRRFLKKEKNRFANPVGQTIAEDVEILFDALLRDEKMEKVDSSLDNIIRIRAVQNFTPSQAVGFVLSLKKLIREEVNSRGQAAAELLDGLEEFNDRIDNMALAAFNVYSQCRRKIYELRINETRNQVSRLLERAGLAVEIPEDDPGSGK